MCLPGMDTNNPTTGQGLTQATATGREPGLNCDRALISALFKRAAHNRDTTLEKQQDLSRLSQVRPHPAETWGSSTSYVSRLQTRGFTSHRFFWLHLNEMQERCCLNELNMCLVSCVMQGPDPSLAYRPNIEPKKTKEEYRNFEVMVRKCVCFMRDIFDCELLNGQNDECKSGTDASDGNDQSKSCGRHAFSPIVLALFTQNKFQCRSKR